MSSLKRKKKLDSMVDNDDVLMEILVRLPVKSLLRFKSVCKHWNSLISSPLFSRCLYPDVYSVSGLFLLRNFSFPSRRHGFVSLTDKPTSHPFETLTFANHPLDLKILQSCHGLLLCSSFCRITGRSDFCIYNPTTMQFRAIPRPHTGLNGGFTLAYNPDKSPHYKVVCVREVNKKDYLAMNMHLSSGDAALYNHSPYQIEIYSSETRSWRLSGKAFIAHNIQSFRRAVFWNGAVHWIHVLWPSFYFKVNEEKLAKMPYPDVWDQRNAFPYLYESREHLHLFGMCPSTNEFDVYEMKEDYSGWFVKYHVNLQAVRISFPLKICGLAVLGIIREAKDEESYMVLHVPGKIIRYKFSDGSFYKIYDWSMDCPACLQLRPYDCYQYIETLASI